MTSQALPDPRTSSVDLELQRKAVTALVCGMPGGDPDHLGFQHPWEIRAFALAVAAHRELNFDWSLFQQALITEISAWENEHQAQRSTSAPSGAAREEGWSYYEHWVAALEAVLATAGLTSRDELDRQTRDVMAIPPNRNHHEAHTRPIAVDPARPTSIGTASHA